METNVDLRKLEPANNQTIDYLTMFLKKFSMFTELQFGGAGWLWWKISKVLAKESAFPSFIFAIFQVFISLKENGDFILQFLDV